MSFEFRYSSSRGEVWRWYWKAWRRRLWIFHAVALLLVGASIWLSTPQGAHWPVPTLRFAELGTLLVLALIAYPQIAFKPRERVLRIDSDGISTQIGSMSGRRDWKQIKSIQDEAGVIVIEGANGNAFLIPERAFRSQAERRDFLTFAEAARQVTPA